MHTDGIMCVPGSVAIVDALARGVDVTDHRPLVVSFVIEGSHGSAPVKRRILDYDLRSLEDPVKGRIFIDKLRLMTPVDVAVDNSSHCFLVDGYVHDALVETFPIPPERKTRDYISDGTFQLIVSSHALRHRLQADEKRFENAILFAVFGCLARMTWRAKWDPVYGFNSRRNLDVWKSTKLIVLQNAIAIKQAIRLERVTWADLKHDELTVCFERNDIVGMHSKIGEMTKYASKSCPSRVTRVINDAGILAQTYGEERSAFREHFSTIMEASECSFEDIILEDRNDALDKYEGIDFQFCWKGIPSPSEVRSMNLRARWRELGCWTCS